MTQDVPRQRGSSAAPPATGGRLVVLTVIFIVLVSASALLGIVGLLQMRADAVPTPSWLQMGSAFLGLYANQAPSWSESVADIPLSFEIALFLAPLSTGYALATAAAVILSERWRLVRARLARNHSIVVGGGRRGVLVSRSLARRGTAVVLVDVAAASERMSAALLKSTIPLSGDPVDDITLRRAGIDRGRELFAVSDDSEMNASIVISARRLRTRAEPFTCYALVSDSDLHSAIEARLLSMPQAPNFRVNLIDRSQVIARGLVDAVAAVPAETVLIAGEGGLVQALALEALRTRVSAAARLTAGRPVGTVSVAGPDADHVVAAIRGSIACEPSWSGALSSAVSTIPALMEGSALGDLVRPFSDALAFVCAESDEDTLRLAFALLRQAKDVHMDVVVCVETASGFAGAFAADGVRIFDDAQGAIRVIAASDFIGDADRIREAATTERIARAFHITYLEHMAADPAIARDLRNTAAWEDLPPDTRESNRAQARHVGDKLRRVGCAVMPTVTGGGYTLTDQDLETLAQAEHERWWEEKRGKGIVYGPERSDRTHPDMVPWAELSEEAREKDRIFIRRLPDILAREGYVIVKFPT